MYCERRFLTVLVDPRDAIDCSISMQLTVSLTVAHHLPLSKQTPGKPGVLWCCGL